MEPLTNKKIVYHIIDELINNETDHQEFKKDILHDAPYVKREAINEIIKVHNLPIELDDDSYDDLFEIDFYLNSTPEDIVDEKVKTEEDAEYYAKSGDNITLLILENGYFEANYDVNGLYDYLSKNPNELFFEQFLEDYVNDKTTIADYFNQKVDDETFRQYVIEQAVDEGVNDKESLKTIGLTLIPFKVITVNIQTTATDIANRYINRVQGKNINDFIDTELNDLLFLDGLIQPVLQFYTDDDDKTILQVQNELINAIDDIQMGTAKSDVIEELNRRLDKDATIRDMMQTSAVEDFDYDRDFVETHSSSELQCEVSDFIIKSASTSIVNDYVKSALGYDDIAEFAKTKLVDMLIDNNQAMVIFECHLDPNELENDNEKDLEEKPTIEYMAKRINDVYYDVGMIEEIKESRYGLLDKLKEVGREADIEINDVNDVNYRITNIQFTTDIDVIAEVFIDDMHKEGLTVQPYLNRFLYDTLITEIDYDVELLTDVEDIKDTSMSSEEDLEESPTIAYMVTRIEDMYDENTMKEIIKESRYGVIDKIKEQLDEVGLDYKHAHEVHYDIKNLRITTDIEALAEVFVQEVKDFGMTVTHYLKEYLYDNLITEVDYDVEILDDIEEL